MALSGSFTTIVSRINKGPGLFVRGDCTPSKPLDSGTGRQLYAAPLKELRRVVEICRFWRGKGCQNRCGTQSPLRIALAHGAVFGRAHAGLIDALLAVGGGERQ